MKVLVVTNPFGGLAIGDTITDPAKMAEVLAGEQAHNVVAADHPAPTKTAKES